MRTLHELEQENIRLTRACQIKEDYEKKLLDLRNQNYDLKQKVQELEWKLDGFKPCESCKGLGSWPAANSGHPQGPDFIEIHCTSCDGDGWVRNLTN